MAESEAEKVVLGLRELVPEAEGHREVVCVVQDVTLLVKVLLPLRVPEGVMEGEPENVKLVLGE